MYQFYYMYVCDDLYWIDLHVVSVAGGTCTYIPTVPLKLFGYSPGDQGDPFSFFSVYFAVLCLDKLNLTSHSV